MFLSFFFLLCICFTYKGTNVKFPVLKTSCRFFSNFSSSKCQKTLPVSHLNKLGDLFHYFFVVNSRIHLWRQLLSSFLVWSIKELLQFKHMKKFPMLAFVILFRKLPFQKIKTQWRMPLSYCFFYLMFPTFFYSAGWSFILLGYSMGSYPHRYTKN